MRWRLEAASRRKYLLTDHLGSVAAITDDEGTLLDQQRYLPFGAGRPNVGSITQTDFGYTGQRDLPGMGLMDYKARSYDSNTGRFIQPDTIIPNPADPQSWNRYSYVRGNPIRYNDPTGHAYCPYSECDIVFSSHSEKMQLRGNLRKAAEGVVREVGGLNPAEALTSILEAGLGAYGSPERLSHQFVGVIPELPEVGPGPIWNSPDALMAASIHLDAASLTLDTMGLGMAYGGGVMGGLSVKGAPPGFLAGYLAGSDLALGSVNAWGNVLAVGSTGLTARGEYLQGKQTQVGSLVIPVGRNTFRSAATTLAGFLPDPTVNWIAAAVQFFVFDNPRLQ